MDDRPQITRLSNDHRKIGGSKGHVEESIQGFLLQLYEALQWKMIPQCTGRYTCRNHATVSHLSPQEVLVLAQIPLTKDWPPCYAFQLKGRADTVLVLPLDKRQTTGMITYVKTRPDGSVQYVHTLNSESGFQRKLEAIGIEGLSEANRVQMGGEKKGKMM